MAHHYKDFVDRTKTQEKKEKTSKEEKGSPLYESDDKASIPIPKTNRPACSNMIE